MAKKRIVLSLEGTPKTEQIVWYKGTAQKDILNSIRENFRIDEQLSFGIYDVDNCYVVLSDSVPDDSKFFIRVDQRGGETPPKQQQPSQRQTGSSQSVDMGNNATGPGNLTKQQQFAANASGGGLNAATSTVTQHHSQQPQAVQRLHQQNSTTQSNGQAVPVQQPQHRDAVGGAAGGLNVAHHLAGIDPNANTLDNSMSAAAPPQQHHPHQNHLLQRQHSSTSDHHPQKQVQSSQQFYATVAQQPQPEQQFIVSAMADQQQQQMAMLQRQADGDLHHDRRHWPSPLQHQHQHMSSTALVDYHNHYQLMQMQQQQQEQQFQQLHQQHYQQQEKAASGQYALDQQNRQQYQYQLQQQPPQPQSSHQQQQIVYQHQHPPPAYALHPQPQYHQAALSGSSVAPSTAQPSLHHHARAHSQNPTAAASRHHSHSHHYQNLSHHQHQHQQQRDAAPSPHHRQSQPPQQQQMVQKRDNSASSAGATGAAGDVMLFSGDAMLSPLPQSVWEQRFKGGGPPIGRNQQLAYNHHYQLQDDRQEAASNSPLQLNRSPQQYATNRHGGAVGDGSHQQVHQYLEAECSQLSINPGVGGSSDNALAVSPLKLGRSLPPMTPGGGQQTECNVMTARTCNEPVSQLFQNGQPVQQQWQAYWHGGGSSGGLYQSQQQVQHQKQQQSHHQQLHHHQLSQQQQARSREQSKQKYHHHSQGGGGRGDQGYYYGANHQLISAASDAPLYAPRSVNQSGTGYQYQYHHKHQHPSQAMLQHTTPQQKKNHMRPQTTMAVDLSPMTHSSQIFVPNYNQRQVGSSLDPKSVHKLNSWYSVEEEDASMHQLYQYHQIEQPDGSTILIPPWNLRFQGGATSSYSPHTNNNASQQPVSSFLQYEDASRHHPRTNPATISQQETPIVANNNAGQSASANAATNIGQQQQSAQMLDPTRPQLPQNHLHNQHPHHQQLDYQHQMWQQQQQRDLMNESRAMTASPYDNDRQYMYVQHNTSNLNVSLMQPTNQNHLAQMSMDMAATAVSMSQLQDQPSVDYGKHHHGHHQHHLSGGGGHHHHHGHPLSQGHDLRQSRQDCGAQSTSGRGSDMKQKQQSTSNQTSAESQARVLVKPSDQGQVLALRQNFLQIARIEREDSKERDKNFMPEVRRTENLVITHQPRLVKRPPKGNSGTMNNQNTSHSQPPPSSTGAYHHHQHHQQQHQQQKLSPRAGSSQQPEQNYHLGGGSHIVNLQNQNNLQQNHNHGAGQLNPPSNCGGGAGGPASSRRMSHENYQSQSAFGGKSSVLAQQMQTSNQQLSNTRRVRSGQDPQSTKNVADENVEKNIFNSPQQSVSNQSMSQKSFSGNSIGGRSLLAQQMNNNGLNFENNSSRLQQRVNCKTEQDIKSMQKNKSSLKNPTGFQQPSPSQTIYNLGQLTSLIDGDGGTPLRNSSSKNHHMMLNQRENNITDDEEIVDRESSISHRQNDKERQSRSRPIGRPVGCKTMNDREFQKYQRSLFLQSSQISNNNNGPTTRGGRGGGGGRGGRGDGNDQNENHQTQQNNPSTRHYNGDGAGSNKRDDDITNDTGPATQQPFLFQENQSEFGISNISQIKGENQSQFLESGEADNLLGVNGSNTPAQSAPAGNNNRTNVNNTNQQNAEIGFQNHLNL